MTDTKRSTAELNGRIKGAYIDAFTRVRFMASNTTGIPDSYKVTRITEIMEAAAVTIEALEAEYKAATCLGQWNTPNGQCGLCGVEWVKHA